MLELPVHFVLWKILFWPYVPECCRHFVSFWQICGGCCPNVDINLCGLVSCNCGAEGVVWFYSDKGVPGMVVSLVVLVPL